MTITTVKNIIKKLIKGEDYRIEVITLIDVRFLEFTISFFKDIVDAKLKNKDITVDWYKKSFLDPSLPTKDIAINSGLNKKTIHNMFNSSTKEIVINAANDNYKLLYQSIKRLIDTENDLDLILTVKFKGVSVDLNISESLIVINALAVKRSELRGGLWSMAGKRVEKPLMQTLCMLYEVPKECYKSKIKGGKDKNSDFEREVDFYLIKNSKNYTCEVKLMGKGNPESADGPLARDSDVFVADKLSEKNKKWLDKSNIEWLELKSKDGFRKFDKVLNNLKIPHTKLLGNIDKKLCSILQKL